MNIYTEIVSIVKYKNKHLMFFQLYPISYSTSDK